jgi:protocatechuate 3,4-dioxygenase beta subunit
MKIALATAILITSTKAEGQTIFEAMKPGACPWKSNAPSPLPAGKTLEDYRPKTV